MKQSTRDALLAFLNPRLSDNGRGDILNMVENCVDLRQREGKDAPELALQTVALLGLIENDLTPDEYERAKSLILEEQTVAQDGAIRGLMSLRSHQQALDEVSPVIGQAIMACDTEIDIYRAGLVKFDIDAQSAPLDAARAMFRHVTGRNRISATNAPLASDSPLAGVSPRMKA